MSDHQSFNQNLEQVALVRHQIANHLEEMTAVVQVSETQAETASGRLCLEQYIQQLKATYNNLRHNKFRLLVLGDMKRGKSTFINALVGENLLPNDVNPCTALLTVLRYGKNKQVIIHFKDDRAETLDLDTFKQKYTISPGEAKLLAAQDKLAFPEVAYAVIEYPLPLLQEGLEIVDSPGLNDTETRNELTLQHIYNCHAVLFLFKASQPCTLDERRYLKNHLQNRDITTFFVINAWDEIKRGLVDPEDESELSLAEAKVRQVFAANLEPYLTSENPRVFEVSALTALRRRLKDSQADLAGTGFDSFMAALNQFLSQEKAIAEFKQAQKVAQTTSMRINEAVDRRISLLDRTIAELKQQVTDTIPEFEELTQIRDRFQQQIQREQELTAQAIADSFSSYILDLEKTFEADFVASQPEINFTDFLDKDKREQFQITFKRAFERYLNDRLASWEFTAKQKLAASFDKLNQQGKAHQLDYEKVVAAINQKLLGSRFSADKYGHNPNQAAPWADNFNDIFFGVPDGVNGAISSFNTFWQTVLASICITLGLRIIGLLFTSVALNIFGAILLGVGTLALQAEYVRRQFLSVTKQEFAKYLPQIAQEQQPVVYTAIESCFDTYQEQIISAINQDLAARQAELTNLVAQKENSEINRDLEIERLQNLKRDVAELVAQIDNTVNL